MAGKLLVRLIHLSKEVRISGLDRITTAGKTVRVRSESLLPVGLLKVGVVETEEELLVDDEILTKQNLTGSLQVIELIHL